jgi:galactose mutarotase-like enzyme
MSGEPPGPGEAAGELDTVAIASPEGELEARFAPADGLVCSSLRFRGEELLAGGQGLLAYAQRGKTMGIPLLYPWANRLAGWGYEAAGERVQLAGDASLLAEDGDGHPIHGVIPGNLRWELLESGATELRGQLRWDRPELLEVFPFEHALEVRASISARTLTIATTVRAGDAGAVPVSFGYHPYLRLASCPREDWLVELPVSSRLLLDEHMIPTGASEAVDFDGPFRLGARDWDDAFAGLPAPALFAVTAGERRIEVEFLTGYTHAQVYSPADADFICLEPMTAPSNALVSGEGLRVLAAGEELRAAFSVSLA